MTNEAQYFSIVTDRIEALQAELEDIQSIKTKENHEAVELASIILEKKINYLQRLSALPLLTIIKHLPMEDLAILENILGIPKEEIPNYLISFYHLEHLTDLINHPLSITYSHIKHILLDEPEIAYAMIKLQQKSFKLNEIKENLYGTTLHQNPNSYATVLSDIKKLDSREEKLEKDVKAVMDSYDIRTVKELRDYKNNPDQFLSNDFILKHQENIIRQFPEMEKMVKGLTSKGIKGKLSKLSPFRKKNEQKFLTAVLSYYQNNESLMHLGLEKQNALEMSDSELRNLSLQIRSSIEEKRDEIANEKNYLLAKKNAMLKQIEACTELQEQYREKFNGLLASKIDFLPLKRIQDQMWYDYNFKDSLIAEACLQEQKDLEEQLMEPFKDTTPLELLAQFSEYKPKAKQYAKVA